jgi:DNA-binding NarL/FixJ family response regulator
MVNASLPRPSNRISVVVAENSLLASQLISGALKRCGSNFDVHALTGESLDALRAVRKYNPDVALISVELKDGPTAGLNVLHEMHIWKIKTAPVVMIDAEKDELVLRAFQSGAKGVFCRGTPLKALSKCIRRIHEGQIWANKDHLQLVLDFLANQETRHIPKNGGMTLLSPREQEVACLVAEGMSNQDIASELKLGEHTVRNYLFHIFNKLGLSSRVELTLYALSPPAAKTEKREPALCERGGSSTSPK